MYIGVFRYFFVFDVTATTEIYTYVHTLSLHDALPICAAPRRRRQRQRQARNHDDRQHLAGRRAAGVRSEEHTSELQSLMRIPYAVFCLKQKQRRSYISSERPSLCFTSRTFSITLSHTKYFCILCMTTHQT